MNEPDGIVNDDKQKYDDEQQSFFGNNNCMQIRPFTFLLDSPDVEEYNVTTS